VVQDAGDADVRDRPWPIAVQRLDDVRFVIGKDVFRPLTWSAMTAGRLPPAFLIKWPQRTIFATSSARFAGTSRFTGQYADRTADRRW